MNIYLVMWFVCFVGLAISIFCIPGPVGLFIAVVCTVGCLICTAKVKP